MVMQEPKIGDRVKINALHIIGTISSIDSLGYNVEYRDKRGNVACRLFIAEELSSADDATGDTVRQNAEAAKSSIDGLIERKLPERV